MSRALTAAAVASAIVFSTAVIFFSTAARQRHIDERAGDAMEQARSLRDEGLCKSDPAKMAAAKAASANALDIARKGSASIEVQQEAETLAQDIEKILAAMEKRRAAAVASAIFFSTAAVDALDIAFEVRALDESAVAERLFRSSPRLPRRSLALADQKKLDDAFRQHIQHNPKDAKAHYHLGLALLGQKRLSEAFTAFRKADELLPRDPVIENGLHLAKRWLDLDKKLSAILANKAQPRSTQERLELAVFCIRYKHYYTAAVRFLSEAFAAKPQLAKKILAQNRYHAARVAALAGAGLGEDAKGLSPEQRTELRQQALDWLRADLAVYSKLPANAVVQQRLAHWREDPALASVRDKPALDRLPKAEREPWRKLWADVAALRKKGQ
jgi:cytochrome c-type biogenesis protein CcmH/NrfG